MGMPISCNSVVLASILTWMQMSNSLGQSPCRLVYANFIARSFNVNYELLSIDNVASFYPQSNTPTGCQCNEPSCALVSACAVCQGTNHLRLKWSEWTTNCQRIYTTYQSLISPYTNIPPWTLIDVEVSSYYVCSSNPLVLLISQSTVWT
jgi:hypothetical protein